MRVKPMSLDFMKLDGWSPREIFQPVPYPPPWSQGGPDSPFYDYHFIKLGQHIDQHRYSNTKKPEGPKPVI
ncbi:MAG: hypothetical protein EBQ67_06565 [Sphingobacteriia bacterium]|nr:hypothetical protein [Sphingobacteriia bacterium]